MNQTKLTAGQIAYLMEQAPVLKMSYSNAARDAALRFFDEKLGGKDAYACGFAWISIYPQHKGNTSLGRRERALYVKLGFKQSGYDKTYQIWNPSGLGCQNIDTKEEGARAGAKVLADAGIHAYCQSRLD